MKKMDETTLPAIPRDLGLSQYEVKCYLSLLERDTLTAAEISRLARIPRPGAYDALEKLTSKGLCTTKPGDTRRYSASDPALLEEKCNMEVERTVEAELRELKEREKQLREKAKGQKESISRAIAELKPRYQNSRQETSPLDYIEIIKDPYQIHRRKVELLKMVKKEFVCFTKPPFSCPPERVREQTDPQAELLKKGGQIRTIHEILKDEEDRKWQLQFVEEGAEAGVQVRVLERVPMKLCVFDSTTVMFMLVDPVTTRNSLTAQIVRHPALAEMLKISFQTLWEQAKDYHVLRG
jgi:sugar-specific transcriptional regulator TrmB